MAARHLPRILCGTRPRAIMRGRRVAMVLREGGRDGGDDFGFEAGARFAPFEKLARHGPEEDV